MEINHDGVLMEPEFHDGYLTGMRIVDKTLHLYLVTIDKQNFIVTIPNVRRMKADNFLEGNIVFELTIYPSASCSEANIKTLYGYNEEQAEKYLPQLMAEIADENLSLLELGSSYGCELQALFGGSIRVEPESEKLDAIPA